MNTHPYLRAYMAGTVAPTMMLLVVLSGFLIARYVFQVPIPIERAIIFPMALVPNMFGAWNLLYVWLGAGRRLPIGFHGAILPFIIAPTGFAVGTSLRFLNATSSGLVWFDHVAVSYSLLAFIFVIALIAYYLVWKYLIGFFNAVLEIA